MIQRLRNGQVRLFVFKSNVIISKTFASYELYAAWRKAILGMLCLVLLVNSKAALADHDDDVRFAAHFGLSYAIDDVTFRISKKAFKMSDWQAQSFAAFTTLFIGLVYKVQENPSGPEMMKSALENAAGIGAASVVRWQFDF